MKCSSANQEIPRISWNTKIITAFQTARYLSLSSATSIQSTLPILFILILSSYLRLGLQSDLFPSDFPTKTLYKPPLYPAQLIWFDHSLLIWIRDLSDCHTCCNLVSPVTVVSTLNWIYVYSFSLQRSTLQRI